MDQQERPTDLLHLIVDDPGDLSAKPDAGTRFARYLEERGTRCQVAELIDATGYDDEDELVLVRELDARDPEWAGKLPEGALITRRVKRCFKVELHSDVGAVYVAEELDGLIGTPDDVDALREQHELSERRLASLLGRERVKEYPPDAADLENRTMAGPVTLAQAATAARVTDLSLTFQVTELQLQSV